MKSRKPRKLRRASRTKTRTKVQVRREENGQRKSSSGFYGVLTRKPCSRFQQISQGRPGVNKKCSRCHHAWKDHCKKWKRKEGGQGRPGLQEQCSLCGVSWQDHRK